MKKNPKDFSDIGVKQCEMCFTIGELETEEKYNVYWYWITPKANHWWYGNYFIMSLEEYSEEEILEKVRLNFPDLYRRLPTNIDGSISIDECICVKPYFEILDEFSENIVFRQTILFIGKNGEEHLNGYYNENK